MNPGWRNLKSLDMLEKCRIDPENHIPSISLFITTPVSGTITLEPKRVLIVVIVEIASPE